MFRLAWLTSLLFAFIVPNPLQWSVTGLIVSSPLNIPYHFPPVDDLNSAGSFFKSQIYLPSGMWPYFVDGKCATAIFCHYQYGIPIAVKMLRKALRKSDIDKIGVITSSKR